MRALFVCAIVAAALLPGAAAGEQAGSRVHRVASSFLDVGAAGSCAVRATHRVRCWGRNDHGQLGYGNTDAIGDDETPSVAGPVDLGAGRTAAALSSGYNHTCAILDNGRVRCWGDGNNGVNGYGSTDDIGDDETPGSVGPVNLGAGRTAVAIADGSEHNCAILDNGKVRCWGSNVVGELGYGNTDDIGDNETPNTAGPVDLGVGRTAVAISGGGDHTCAILDNGKVRCWGDNERGELGYGNTDAIGDNETPGSVGPVDLGGKLAIRAASELSLDAKPKRDRARPFKFKVSGKLSGFLADQATCRGTVRVTARRGSDTTGRASARLRLRQGDCTYGTTLRSRRKGRLELTARFPGSTNLTPDKSNAVMVRAG